MTGDTKVDRSQLAEVLVSREMLAPGLLERLDGLGWLLTYFALLWETR